MWAVIRPPDNGPHGGCYPPWPETPGEGEGRAKHHGGPVAKWTKWRKRKPKPQKKQNRPKGGPQGPKFVPSMGQKGWGRTLGGQNANQKEVCTEYGARTHDLGVISTSLYRLSYATRGATRLRATGIEPVTNRYLKDETNYSLSLYQLS